MKLDVNNVIVYLLLAVGLGLGGWGLNKASQLSIAVNGLVVEVKNLKEDDGEINHLRDNLKRNWDKYGTLNDKYSKLAERIAKLED